VRQRDPGLPPRQYLAFTLVLLVGVRFDNGAHAAIGLRDNLLVTPQRFRKILATPTALRYRSGVAKRDLLYRALADFETVVLARFAPRLGESLISGEIDDRALSMRIDREAPGDISKSPKTPRR